MALRRMSLNLTDRAQAALDRLTAGGANATDAINRAICLAAVVEGISDDGAVTVLRADGTRERIHLI